MSSLQEIRKKQIAEVLDADRNISRAVFHREFNAIRQFQDTLKEPSPAEKKVSYEIERYIIDLESILTDIQGELEQSLAPVEGRLLEQVGNPDVESSSSSSSSSSEEEDRVGDNLESLIKGYILSTDDNDNDSIKEWVDDNLEDETPLWFRWNSLPYSKQMALIYSIKQDIELEESELEKSDLEGSAKKKKLRGGAKEVKISLLEVWNKFVNYISKIANYQQFTQNDFLVLYDRLDDLIPLLQSIIRLSEDAKSVDVPTPISEGIIEILLSKIQNRDISPIIPSKELSKYSSAYSSKIKQDIDKLKALIPTLVDKKNFRNFNKEKDAYLLAIEQSKAIRDRDEVALLKQELADLTKRYKNSIKLQMTQEDVEKRIAELEKPIKLGRFQQEPIKASRQPLRGQGKTASSQILKNFDNETYRIYESIPSLSYDQLENLYIDLQDKLKFAQEHNDDKNWDKYNFLSNAVLADDRTKDIQRILGNGRTAMSYNKYAPTSMPLPFNDAGNEMYSY